MEISLEFLHFTAFPLVIRHKNKSLFPASRCFCLSLLTAKEPNEEKNKASEKDWVSNNLGLTCQEAERPLPIHPFKHQLRPRHSCGALDSFFKFQELSGCIKYNIHLPLTVPRARAQC